MTPIEAHENFVASCAIEGIHPDPETAAIQARWKAGEIDEIEMDAQISFKIWRETSVMRNHEESAREMFELFPSISERARQEELENSRKIDARLAELIAGSPIL